MSLPLTGDWLAMAQIIPAPVADLNKIGQVWEFMLIPLSHSPSIGGQVLKSPGVKLLCCDAYIFFSSLAIHRKICKACANIGRFSTLH